MSEERSKDGTLGRNIGRFGGFLVGDFIDQTGSVSNRTTFKNYLNSRFKANNVTHELTLVPLLVRHLAGPVDHLNALHPFIRCEFDLARPVVQVTDEARHDFFDPRRGLRARSINDMLGEIGIETICCASHVGEVCVFKRQRWG